MQSKLAGTEKPNDKIENVIVIASYLEALALPIFLNDLCRELTNETLIIIADDSPPDYFAKLKSSVNQQFLNTELNILWSHNPNKSGRGAAVKRGMDLAINSAPKFKKLIECDADGSHTSDDIAKILANQNDVGVVIGSRYISGSKIVGWSLKRKLFSKLINLIIPRLLNIDSHDVTNGLRMYSRHAVEIITSNGMQCSGFIYLSEQLLICRKNNLQILEIPVTFVNRTQGNSSVTRKEIADSVLGILKLWKMRK